MRASRRQAEGLELGIPMTVHATLPDVLTPGSVRPVALHPETDTRYDLSLIAVCYRQPALLAAMLGSLARERVTYEVIVVNASPEAEIAIPKDLPYPVRLVSEDNRGYAHAVNKGLAAARGEFVAACNVDLEFGEGALSQAVQYIRRHPDVGVVAPELVFPDGARQYSARRFYTWRVAAWARAPWRGRTAAPSFYREHLMMDEPALAPREVDWATGAMLVVRRSAMRRADQFFDSRYWLYMEDVDLCVDMWKRGWKVVQLPHLKIVHRYSRASKKTLSTAGLHHAASFLKFIVKHGGLPQRSL